MMSTSIDIDTVRTQQTHDAKLARLESLCEEAKADWNSSHTSRFGRANAAKFLRDTVENTICYIQSNKLAISDQLLPSSKRYYEEKLKDLYRTYREATTSARMACYGKSRAFEVPPANQEPLKSQIPRIPYSRREATGPRRSPSHVGERAYSSLSSSFPPAGPSLYRSRGRRSASPLKTPNINRKGYQRLKHMHGDRYRPARKQLAEDQS